MKNVVHAAACVVNGVEVCKVGFAEINLACDLGNGSVFGLAKIRLRPIQIGFPFTASEAVGHRALDGLPDLAVTTTDAQCQPMAAQFMFRRIEIGRREFMALRRSKASARQAHIGEPLHRAFRNAEFEFWLEIHCLVREYRAVLDKIVPIPE